MDLQEAVIKLHYIARLVEEQIGAGQLSEDVRSCADKLNTLIKPMPLKEKIYDPTI